MWALAWLTCLASPGGNSEPLIYVYYSLRFDSDKYSSAAPFYLQHCRLQVSPLQMGIPSGRLSCFGSLVALVEAGRVSVDQTLVGRPKVRANGIIIIKKSTKHTAPPRTPKPLAVSGLPSTKLIHIHTPARPDIYININGQLMMTTNLQSKSGWRAFESFQEEYK